MSRLKDAAVCQYVQASEGHQKLTPWQSQAEKDMAVADILPDVRLVDV